VAPGRRGLVREPILPKGDPDSTADIQAFTDLMVDAISSQADRARVLAQA